MIDWFVIDRFDHYCHFLHNAVGAGNHGLFWYMYNYILIVMYSIMAVTLRLTYF